jgi:hypothetical protein
LDKLSTAPLESLERWLTAIGSSISHIHPHKHAQLIAVVLQLRPICVLGKIWTSLASTHGELLDRVLRSLVSALASSEAEEGVHEVIERIAGIIPAASSRILMIIKEKFPYWKSEKGIVVEYTRNIVRVLSYLKCLRDQMIRLVISKICALDLMVPGKYLEERVEGEHDLEVEENIEKVDGMMKIMFGFLEQVHVDSERAQEGGLMHMVFGSLLFAFETMMLRTEGSKAAQFLILYYCSFNHMYYEILLKRLCERLFEPTESPVIRENCAYYIASFLCAANFVRGATILHYWTILLEWIKGYIEVFENHIQDLKCDVSEFLNPEQHRVFYSVCTCLFYLFNAKYEVLQVLVNPEEYANFFEVNADDEMMLSVEDRLIDLFEPLFASSLRVFQYCETSSSLPFLKQILKLGLDDPVVTNTIEQAEKYLKSGEDTSIKGKDHLAFKMPFQTYLFNESSEYVRRVHIDTKNQTIDEASNAKAMDDSRFQVDDEECIMSYVNADTFEPISAE